MKKILSVFLVVFLLFLPFSGSRAEETLLQATVVSVQGNVTVIAKGKEYKAEECMKLNIGDTIRTASDSTAEIAYDNDWENVTSLEENTELIVESVGPTQIDMIKGKLLANLDALDEGETFEVRTPTCAATARGTIFDVTIENGESEVSSFEDEVAVYGIDKRGQLFGEKRISAGDKINIQRRKKPGKARRMKKAEWKLGRDRAKNMRSRARKVRRRRGLSFKTGLRKKAKTSGRRGVFSSKRAAVANRLRNSKSFNRRSDSKNLQRNVKKKDKTQASRKATR